VAQKMAEINETVVLKNESPFNFEKDTEDSDYLGVKRIKFDWGFKWSESNEKDKLDKHLKATKTLVLKKETIELLPNAKIQLTIRLHQIGRAGVVQINIGTKTPDLNIEIAGLCRIEVCRKITQTDVKLLMTTGDFFMAPFELKSIQHDMHGCLIYDIIQIGLVFKVPNDMNTFTAMPILDCSSSEVEFSDFEIICEDQTFKCHKLFLAFKSDVFKAMLYHNKCTENTTGTVHVDDINAKTMNTLLKYLYQNKITYEEATDLNLIVAANKYNIVDLVSKCEKNILLIMSMKNIMDILAITKLLPTPNLFEKVLLFFNQMKDQTQVEHGPKWLELKTQNPALALEIAERCLNMKIYSEEVNSNGPAINANETK
jgi:hypothetical protein